MMMRWIFAFVLFGLMFALACGLQTLNLVSAQVEQIAFLLVPAVFMIASIVGLGLRRQV
jgi:hypothetical protein